MFVPDDVLQTLRGMVAMQPVGLSRSLVLRLLLGLVGRVSTNVGVILRPYAPTELPQQYSGHLCLTRGVSHRQVHVRIARRLVSRAMEASGRWGGFGRAD